MGIRRTFNALHGIKDNIEDEKRRFVERINQGIFHEVDTNNPRRFDYEHLLERLCLIIGCNCDDLWQTAHRTDSVFTFKQDPPRLRSLTGDDFTKTLQVLTALASILSERNNSTYNWLTDRIQVILSESTRDLGIKWKDGIFRRSGPEELDRPLVEETLTWLDGYPEERTDYHKAVEFYAAGDSLGDVVRSCYCAFEGTVRRVLNNTKTLRNNKDEILRRAGLSDGWKAMLGAYVNYAHDFRHASENRHAITKAEAEAYLYMTGLLIRLIIESGQEAQPPETT